MNVQELGIDEIAAKLGEENEEFVANHLRPLKDIEGVKIFYVELSNCIGRAEYAKLIANTLHSTPNIHLTAFAPNRRIAGKLILNAGHFIDHGHVLYHDTERIVLEYEPEAPCPVADIRVVQAFPARIGVRVARSNVIHVIGKFW